MPYYGKYKLIFTSDSKEFGGHNRTELGTEHFTDADFGTISMYCTQRTAYIFELVDKEFLPVLERKQREVISTEKDTSVVANTTKN